MAQANGHISRYIAAIAFLISLVPTGDAIGQTTILDSTLTFRAGSVKTRTALDLITRQTGYFFTYDTRLIDPERRTLLTFREVTLRTILDSILDADSLAYSVIDEFIIISREIAPPHSQAADSISVTALKFISGKIIDRESAEVLPYATIGLKNAGRGTVSNSGGEFSLKLLPEYYDDTLTVSYLGYYTREIPVRQSLGNNFEISMIREFISIPEIIIRNQIPSEIVRKTLSTIGRNYGNTPASLTAFYREGVLKRTELQSYSEAILRIYKSAYTGTLLNDQIKVLISRKIDNVGIDDSLAIRLKAGLSTCLQLDGMKTIFDFINKESMVDYTYRLLDIVSFDEESAYEIGFTHRPESEEAIFNGSMFINSGDFAILRTEFEIDPEFLQKMKEKFVSSPSRQFTTWPVSVKYSVSYRKVGNRYYLSHVRGDLAFSSRQKKKLFNTPFKVFFEMAVTDISLENVERFEREELAPIHSVFSKTITNYDQEFWGNQDFLKPEENLLDALENMDVRLQEFRQ